ncbi:9722_t:CDS:1, partial [Racocetra persica]
ESNGNKGPKVKYNSQFKAARAITALTKPVLQSVNQTIEARPPRNILLSQEEKALVAQLDPAQFN